MYCLVIVIRPEDLPTDPAALTEIVLALDAENEKLRLAMRTLNDLVFGFTRDQEKSLSDTILLQSFRCRLYY